MLDARAIDLPATRRSGSLLEAVAYAEARAKPGTGLMLEIAGGVALLASEALLLRSAPRASRAVARTDRPGRDPVAALTAWGAAPVSAPPPDGEVDTTRIGLLADSSWPPACQVIHRLLDHLTSSH